LQHTFIFVLKINLVYVFYLHYIYISIAAKHEKLTTMTYFQNCQTLQEVKELFRKLAMQYHPDRGGDTATMQQIIHEYNIATVQILSGTKMTQEEQSNEFDLSEQYRQVIEKIIALEGINIELSGSWIWVTGATYPVRKELKSAGLFFAKNKCAWFYRPAECKVHNRHKMTLEQIRAKYGSKKINTVSSHSLSN
jgi:hypothetical protein